MAESPVPFRESLADYLAARPANLSFPYINDVPIPTAAETALIGWLGMNPRPSRLEVDEIRPSLSIDDGYYLASFAIRMALLAVRQGNRSLLHNGLIGLAIDDGAIDWRDVLRSLSMVEYCAHQLQIDFDRELRGFLDLASERRRGTFYDDYLARSDDWRTPEIMGHRATGAGPTLSFEDR